MLLRRFNATTANLGMGPLVPAAGPVPTKLLISGITRNSAGAVLGSCTVKLFCTLDDLLMETVTSDPSTGVYQFSPVGASVQFYVVAYKAGSPDVAETTVNTLAGV